MLQILDNGELPKTVSVNSSSRRRSLPVSRKRSRDKEESSNDAHPRNKNDTRNKTATGSAEFVVDLELADEVEVVSPRKKRRAARSERSGKASGQQLKITAWEDRLSELADYHKIHGHCNVPRNYSEKSKLGKWVANQRSYYRLQVKGKASSLTLSRIQELESIGFEWDGSSTTSQKPSTSKPPSNAQYWEARLRELSDYCKEHGHCDVPTNYSENVKLAKWVGNQRSNYKLHLEGKTSPMTTFRIQELESLGFEWGLCNTAWEDRLSELADYRKIYGHCNVPRKYNENTKLGKWVATQRSNYRLHREGKKSFMTLSRIQELGSLGFDWGVCRNTWEDRLSELADYRTIHGHCNVPQNYSENSKLANWVATQRYQYKLHLEGNISSMTLSRIRELEGIGFEWGVFTAWEDRLGELTDYRKIHGHCNVPKSHSKNTKLATWVANQRTYYRLQVEGKRSPMTLSRIQALESLGFDWKPSTTRVKKTLKKPSLEDYARRAREVKVPLKKPSLEDYARRAREVKVTPKKPSLEDYARRAREVKVPLKKPSLEDYARRAREVKVPLKKPSLEDYARRAREAKVPLKKPSLEDYARRAREVKVTLKKPSLEDRAGRARERAAKAAEYVQTTAQT
jgi:hypothetical protein